MNMCLVVLREESVLKKGRMGGRKEMSSKISGGKEFELKLTVYFMCNHLCVLCDQPAEFIRTKH